MKKVTQDMYLQVGCRDLEFFAFIKIILRITSFLPLSLKNLFFKVSLTAHMRPL